MLIPCASLLCLSAPLGNPTGPFPFQILRYMQILEADHHVLDLGLCHCLPRVLIIADDQEKSGKFTLLRPSCFGSWKSFPCLITRDHPKWFLSLKPKEYNLLLIFTSSIRTTTLMMHDWDLFQFFSLDVREDRWLTMGLCVMRSKIIAALCSEIKHGVYCLLYSFSLQCYFLKPIFKWYGRRYVVSHNNTFCLIHSGTLVYRSGIY